MDCPPPFRDPRRSSDERVTDLLARLTLEEKIGLLHQYQQPVPRLGLAAFRTGTEALHGLAWCGPATVYPQAVGLGATWDTDLVERVGEATAAEVLAYHRKDPDSAGRNVWAPVVNPLRDPRWGRNEEGYAEDPWLTGVMAVAYARGLAGDDPNRLRTAPTLKHFLAYNHETTRCSSSSHLPERVLREYELPAFLAPLAAGVAVAVMPSYNLVNGRPAHLSPLINSELRAAAAEPLLVVSDAYAPGNIADPAMQGFHADHVTAYAHALRAGLDSFTQDDDNSAPTLGLLRTALEQGLITEGDIDAAAGRALSVRVRLGEFDPDDPYPEVGEETIGAPEHRELARVAARRSMVLLKNDGLLPLRDPRRVAVIGQLADTVLEDWYSGTLPYAVTAREGIAEWAETVVCEGVDRVALRTGSGYVAAPASGGPARVQPGTDLAPLGATALFDVFDWGGACALRAGNGCYLAPDSDGVLVNDQPGPSGWEVPQIFRMRDRPDGATVLFHIATGDHVAVDAGGRLALVDDADAATPFVVDVLRSGATQAAAAAGSADVAVVVAGDHPLVNGRETEDRRDLDLPAGQEAVVRAVRAANPDTVLVLSSGYPYAVTWAEQHVPAVLWSAHGGQEYGHALADVLFGEADPAGRLPQTWYRSATELGDLFDYDIIANDATYLYYLGSPLYPFGHGLSYTRFDYDDLDVHVDEEAGTVSAEATVTNRGSRAGEEVVQLYTQQRASRVKQPVRQLRGFDRLSLAPGESARARITFPIAALAHWDTVQGRFVVEDAPRKAQLGRSSRDIRLCAHFTVPGETVPARPARGPAWRAAAFDEYQGVELCPRTPQDGDAVRSTEADAWVAFLGCDFGAGARRCRLELGSAEGGRVTLRLDDPLTGPCAGEVLAPVGPETGVEFPLSGADGERDCYLVFEKAGITLAGIGFPDE
jgi:beta-glucosidase